LQNYLDSAVKETMLVSADISALAVNMLLILKK
jgi:hypothetical protein